MSMYMQRECVLVDVVLRGTYVLQLQMVRLKLSGMRETYYYANVMLPFNERLPSDTRRGMLMFCNDISSP